jgi:hypothetical protein
MSTQFPAALDVLQNPSDATNMDNPAFLHAAQHANANDAIEALQLKIGIDGSTDVNSLDHKVSLTQTKILFVGEPVSATSTGVAGTVIVSNGYIYVCTATNTWVRSAVATW